MKEEIETLKGEIEELASDNAYLRGKIAVYEDFLRTKGFIKDPYTPIDFNRPQSQL